MRGDLDWIVMKSLEKDRTRRYETANGFALDIRALPGRRAGAGRAAQCPLPAAEVRPQASGGLNDGRGDYLAPPAGAAVSTWQAVRRYARRRSCEANERPATRIQVAREKESGGGEADRPVGAGLPAEQAARSGRPRTQADALLRNGGLSAEAKENPTIRELLDRAAKELAPERIDANFPNQPLVQAAILQTVGNTYRGVGDYEPAIGFLQRSAALYRQTLGPDHPTRLPAGTTSPWRIGRPGSWTWPCRSARNRSSSRKPALGPDHPDTLASMSNLAGAYRGCREAGPGPAALRGSAQAHASEVPRPSRTLTAWTTLPAYQAAGKLDLALPLFKETLKLRKAKLRPDHPDTLVSMNNLARAYQAVAKLGLALPLFEETLKLMKAKLGPDHPDTLTSMNNLALAYRRPGSWTWPCRSSRRR